MKINLIVIAIFLSIHIFADDWQKNHQPSDDNWKKTEQHFIFNNGAEPQSLDPALITGLLEFRIIEAIFEGLTTLDPETVEVRPALASSWTISTDQLTYTFSLRKNAKWTDGTPVTAKDFLDSWERVLNPQTPSEYKYQLYPIKNAKKYANKEITKFEDVGVKVNDPYTLVVTLERPCHYFLNLTSFQTLYPVPIKLIKEKGDKWILPENIITNGGFKLDEWKRRQHIILSKNQNYWDKNIIKLEKVTILPIDDVETSYKKFRNKELHWEPNVPVSKVKEARHLPEYYRSEALSCYYYRINVTKKPFDNVNVRKALSMSIDRETLTKHVLNNINIPATWFCPPAGGYQHVEGLPYDPKKAKELLNSAGINPTDANPFTIAISYNSSESHKIIAEYISEQWKKNLGIKTQLNNMEWKTYLEDMTALKFEVMRSGWYADYNDPNTFMDMMVTEGGNNRTGWSNKRYDQLLEKAQNETDTNERMKIYQEMERILVEEELPIIPLYIGTSQGLISEKVNGWYENILNFHPLKYIWLED